MSRSPTGLVLPVLVALGGVAVAAPPLVIDALPAAPELEGEMSPRQGGNGGRR